MGYRELLKKYIRFLELHLGDNYVEAIAGAAETMMSPRDVAELRTLAGEIFREAHAGDAPARVENYNYRLRLLFNRYELTVDRAAALAGVAPETVRGWRTSPRSARYLRMSAAEFDAFERSLLAWLERSDCGEETPPEARPPPSFAQGT
jgi:hypothetical protein